MTLADQPRVDQDLLRQARIDLAAALRAAALYGYNEGIDNHFSYAVPGSDNLFLLNTLRAGVVGADRLRPAGRRR